MQTCDHKNTYLESKALWNDIYGGIQAKLENAYRIIFYLIVVIAVAIIGLVICACEIKVKPMPFILHGNDVITLSDENTRSFESIKPKLSLMMAENFIRHARMMSSDNTVNTNNHIAALSMVNGAATEVLKNYFESQKSNAVLQNSTVNVQINSILADSNHSLQIRWTEKTRNAQSGDISTTSQYIAEMTYAYQSPSSNSIILKNNPLGFVVTHLSWSQEQQTSEAN